MTTLKTAQDAVRAMDADDNRFNSVAAAMTCIAHVRSLPEPGEAVAEIARPFGSTVSNHPSGGYFVQYEPAWSNLPIGTRLYATPAPVVSEWRTIESAPRDETWIILTGGHIDYGWYADQPPCVVGQWTTDLNGGKHDGCWQFAWYDGGYYGEYVEPTHWMLYPQPPAVQGKSDE